MSIFERERAVIARAAFEITWAEFQRFEQLTPDEKASGPRKLREYIEILVATGEQNPEKIARCALGLVREYEQIARSRGRLAFQASKLERPKGADNMRHETFLAACRRQS
jgi:hypothetical protein